MSPLTKAVFAVIKTPKGILVTTRPEDTKNSIGLPGGKVDPGETNVLALVRECAEEGVQIDINNSNIELIHQSIVDNAYDVSWYLVEGEYELLSDYKEAHRGIVIETRSVEEVANSGYGNEFLLEYSSKGK
jgi:ADP-ribose pyrophosphatase YjhB (NUDIX family)